ncbi:hypothetical protein PPYR_04487 [Photinus pyralis]|uniref:DDE Tnp4 domain-containing protein n=1 Tax=Photinus pyralis TaxID=7054 RepID=A0A5N4AY64_PHOPY|nr:hypothetical protein PPYR_04487 [Photinus pyralis]
MGKNKVNLCLLELLTSSSSEDEEDWCILINNRQEFQKYFRLRRNTAELLIQKFKQCKHQRNDHGGRAPISAEIHIYSFLWFAGNKCTMKDVAQRFNITESSFHRAKNRVMDFLMELGPTIIKFPRTEKEKQHLADNFRKVAGFPGTIGCIDGTSIPIRTPAHKIKCTYVNRHDMPSITLQGICDYKRRFLDIFTGLPGKIHDSRVFKMSDISRQLPEICGQTLDIKTVTTITRFIICCCILHNFCIDADDFLNNENICYEERIQSDPVGESEWQARKRGEEKRNYIKRSLLY